MRLTAFGNQTVTEVIKGLSPVLRELVLPHTLRVRGVAECIGLEMCFGLEELAAIKLAATTHDWAKIQEEFRDLFEFGGKFNRNQIRIARLHTPESAVLLLREFNSSHGKCDFDVVAPAILMVAGHHWSYQESERKFRIACKRLEFSDVARHCFDRNLDNLALVGGHILKVADCFVTSLEKRHYQNQPNFSDYRLAYKDLKLQADHEYSSHALEALGNVIQRPLMVKKLLKGLPVV